MFSIKVMLLIATLICLSSGESNSKKSIKRGIDDYGYPGFGGWNAGLKLSPVHTAPSAFIPPVHDVSHLVAASKKAAFDVHLAQQYVNAAKEDVVLSQKLVKEKETQALIAHQKSEAAQHSLRSEAHNLALAQQKLAKAKAFFAHQQLLMARAEEAAKLSLFKQNVATPNLPGPWNLYGSKSIAHHYNAY